jgi:deazaflavin-dependent oxidoreductase (nitroreductase family)
MAAQYRVTPVMRTANRVMVFLIRRGLFAGKIQLLTVRGRKSGQPHTNLVLLLNRDGQQYLVSPYGEVNWVKNARMTGEVSLFQSGDEWAARLEELPTEQAGPVLKQYLTEHPITRSYFEAQADAPEEAFVREAPQHPVFRLRRV